MKFTICMVLLLFLALESNAQFACNSAPCANSATCYNSREGNTFFCLCPAGYTGVQCEISLPGTCPPNYACVNGICNSDLMGTPHCACYIGYSGVDCSIRGPETSCHLLTPCQNDGICFTLSTDLSLYICVCTEQFTGKHCEILATTIEDRCDPNPCKNNANCSVDEHNPGGYYCACLQGFSGENCSLDDTLTCTYSGQTYSSQEVRQYDCNLCTCINGMWSCTEAACGGMCEYEDMIYLENDSRQEDCNTCYCLNGGWICTTEECNENVCLYEKSDYIEIYDEDEHRWEECNVCYCLNGLWACTLDSCCK
ncbi:uncharacterized protein [Antedon mediterranea]|uniref:uncharacterized protein n=1 Tax=Antedon mediterranea TaxID=105859 RepID=UPI003AF779DD